MSPQSYCEDRYKLNFISGLIHRTWNLSSTYQNAHKGLTTLSERLNSNGYKTNFIRNIIKKKLNKIYNNHKDDSVNTNKVIIKKESKPNIYIKIPYSEGFKIFKKEYL